MTAEEEAEAGLRLRVSVPFLVSFWRLFACSCECMVKVVLETCGPGSYCQDA